MVSKLMTDWKKLEFAGWLKMDTRSRFGLSI